MKNKKSIAVFMIYLVVMLPIVFAGEGDGEENGGEATNTDTPSGGFFSGLAEAIGGFFSAIAEAIAGFFSGIAGFFGQLFGDGDASTTGQQAPAPPPKGVFDTFAEKYGLFAAIVATIAVTIASIAIAVATPMSVGLAAGIAFGITTKSIGLPGPIDFIAEKAFGTTVNQILEGLGQSLNPLVTSNVVSVPTDTPDPIKIFPDYIEIPLFGND